MHEYHNNSMLLTWSVLGLLPCSSQFDVCMQCSYLHVEQYKPCIPWPYMANKHNLMSERNGSIKIQEICKCILLENQSIIMSGAVC